MQSMQIKSRTPPAAGGFGPAAFVLQDDNENHHNTIPSEKKLIIWVNGFC